MTFHVYDTTLRDGAQQEGMHLTVDDKLQVARLLDELGVGFIEGGWPGAVPRDTEFFRRAADELHLAHATLAAFGATRKAGTRAEEDPQVLALLEAGAPVVTLVAKSDVRHVERALRTTGEENLEMVADTVSFLVREGRRVMVDAEHFFDGYRYDAAYTLSVLRAALDAGAEVVVLCDTNGGMVPAEVERIVGETRSAVGPVPVLGIHAHNDSGCAVANSLAAVGASASHVQGTVNGYGERTGNADLITVIADLDLKTPADAGTSDSPSDAQDHPLTRPLLAADGLAEATRIAHAIAEITNIAPFTRQPYVGTSAFAHKAGLHASAIRVDPDLYQHIDPALVGNDRRMLVSDMAGRSSIELKGQELGFDLSGQGELLRRVTATVKDAEARGYTYDAADASFELLLRAEIDGALPEFFTVESWRTIVETGSGAGSPGGSGTGTSTDNSEADAREAARAEATVRLRAGGHRRVTTAEGNGPVNALDHALRESLVTVYPELEGFELVDFKVRILDQQHGTDATTRVMIETTDGVHAWSTVGVGPNVIEASWEALVESAVYGLLHADVAPR
jgi:2-isopropylmalate synthase